VPADSDATIGPPTKSLAVPWYQPPATQSALLVHATELRKAIVVGTGGATVPTCHTGWLAGAAVATVTEPVIRTTVPSATSPDRTAALGERRIETPLPLRNDA
jgi:hypothetical protein